MGTITAVGMERTVAMDLREPATEGGKPAVEEAPIEVVMEAMVVNTMEGGMAIKAATQAVGGKTTSQEALIKPAMEATKQTIKIMLTGSMGPTERTTKQIKTGPTPTRTILLNSQHGKLTITKARTTATMHGTKLPLKVKRRVVCNGERVEERR